ncbi:hypothetical protein [Rothia nasimurium]|uniref:hypothetical protein n=1 Tax=Rothia nasimurium TaxID=85336 RepID=UPI001F462975|nr:hypothetical protein [Rothia nasimurium]
MSAPKKPAPWGGIMAMLPLIITAAVLNVWADRLGPSWPATSQTTEAATDPAKTAQSSAAAQASAPSMKFHYYSREPVIGAYITTDGTPRVERNGWSTGSAGGTENIWYASGEETEALLISSTSTVTRIVWVLPDGSQRVQEGDLTYYDPETGIYE